MDHRCHRRVFLGQVALVLLLATIATKHETHAKSAEIIAGAPTAANKRTQNFGPTGSMTAQDDGASNFARSKKPRKGVLIMQAIDGSLVGISKSSGTLLWSRPGNSEALFPASNVGGLFFDPLLATTTTTTTTTSADPLLAPRMAAVPSTDGTVYLTRRLMGQEEDVTVTTTVAELVTRAPFMDRRGRVYTGSLRSAMVALDANTGEILEVVVTPRSPDDEQLEEQSWTKEGKEDGDDSRDIIWVGRADHSVTVHDTQSGEPDVKFRSATIQSVHDMLLSTGEDEIDDSSKPWNPRQQWSNKPLKGLQKYISTHPTSSVQTDAWSLIVTPGGNAALRDLETGALEWVAGHVFASPVAVCLDADTGRTVDVEVVPDVVSPHGSAEALSRELERQVHQTLKSTTVSTNGGTDTIENPPHQPIVGSLKSGQLFAMPLGVRPLINEEDWQDDDDIENDHDRKDRLSDSSESKISNNHLEHNSFAVPPSEAGSKVLTSDQKKKPCSPGHSSFPHCLVQASYHRGGDVRSTTAESDGDPFAELGYQDAAEDRGLVPMYHHYFGYMHPPFIDNTQQFRNKQGRNSWNYFKFFRGYLVPTILSLFVASFEMGRRKRQHDKENQEILNKKSASSTETAVVGIIRVQEDVILGYGGHGTVVYQGTLEGRQVAVKRMLKAYHASADREISLLIESDGHSNVVRYFLKEVRGDFVYLALELCDLSLHDLINTFQSASAEPLSVDVSFSTKAILSQIASGVSHLHRLRIVHRDLKPANILLADSKKSKRKTEQVGMIPIFELFQSGDYVAKISDMGLGKQLSGQSSFGASALGDASLRGHSNGGGQSSTAGPGPGSVGWQAPEVMAKRISSDISVRSDGSGPAFATSDSLPDASPLDFTSSGTRTSRSVDIFSLGCIFYSLLIPGSHPFGEWYEREANIMHNRPNIEALRAISADAFDLVRNMIQRNPLSRPTAKQVCEHQFFWSATKRLAFLCDFSDRLETDAICEEEHAAAYVSLLAVEKNAVETVGVAWDVNLDDSLVSNVQRFRTYDASSVRDLLRLIRNKHHHFDELPEQLRDKIGTNTNGLMAYFDAHFPSLLTHCVSVCRDSLPASDSMAAKYGIAPIGRQTPTNTAAKEETLLSTPASKEESSTRPRSEIEQSQRDCTDRHRPEAISCSVLSPIFELEPPELSCGTVDAPGVNADGIIVWEGSNSSKTLNCRGWTRADHDWERCIDSSLRKRDSILKRCAEDPKFRTRLCNHWDVSLGMFCPMKKKGKCVFAHGPVELRVKEAKRGRWGKLVDSEGNNKNPNHSGGEDTYGAARSIEKERKQEGKWNTKTKAGPKVRRTQALVKAQSSDM